VLTDRAMATATGIQLVARPLGRAQAKPPYAFDAFVDLRTLWATGTHRDAVATRLGELLGLSLREIRDRSYGDRVALGSNLDARAAGALQGRLDERNQSESGY